MKSRLPGLPAGRRLIALDAALALWAVVWVVLALEVATEVRGLSDLSSTVSRVGTAVEESGKALSELTNLPLGVGIASMSRRSGSRRPGARRRPVSARAARAWIR